MRAIAFCDRESDLARMTIFDDGDRLVARRRRIENRIEPTHQDGRYNDLWQHMRSGRRYVRHDDVYDEDAGIACYDYSSNDDGRLWLRNAAEWEQEVNGVPRYQMLSHGERP